MIIAVATILFVLTTTTASSNADGIFQRVRQRKNPSYQPSRERKPNIVLILTDDQDIELGSLKFMPKTLRAIRDQGAEFRHAYVTTPMCCPSRSSLLTGMYVHNHHVYTNNDNCSSTHWQATYETRSFATYLSNAGYRTGYFGKYLNKYNGSYVPPGWREWGGLIMNSKYYNYSINMNGKKIKHGFDYYKDYYPDLIANDSIAFLRQSKKNSAHKPVMLTMSFPAPHGPEDSAPQYSHLFFNVTTHHTPSYDYAPNPDKQWILQVTKKMQPIHKQFTDLLMTKRLQTLQSVDAAVELIVEELKALGELDNTYIIYTSDHGYHLGQFGLIKGKSFPFEFDVRIPFLVRGPGVEPGTVVDDIVLNIDLAPTFLDIAGVEAPSHMDGRSVLPLFLNSKRKRSRWPDTFLIESSGRRETPYLDAKTKLKTSIRRNITTEMPPTTSAPHDSMATSPKPSDNTIVLATSTSRKIYESGEDLALDSFGDDEGDDIDDEDDIDDDDDIDGGYDDDDGDGVFAYSNENVTSKNLIRDDEIMVDERNFPVNKLERLTMECALVEMKPPCKGNQKWYCENDNGRWRKHKCKLEPQVYDGSKFFKKCACFTPAGLVYKKIPVRNITRRHSRPDRIKRETRQFSHEMTSRDKRDTLDHVETVMKDVQGKLNDLKTANTSLHEEQHNLATNTISETSAGCVIVDQGRVNCSTVIYNDRKTWRQSRHQIDNEIYQLKQKLEKLKEIRRHLKHTKPIIDQADDEDEERSKIGKLESQDANVLMAPLEQEVGMSTEQYNANGTRTRKNKKRTHEGGNTLRPIKRPKSRPELEIIEEMTTSGPSSGHSNHHRHNHKYYGTTKGIDGDFSTVNRRSTTTVTTTTETTTTTVKPRPLDDLIPYPNTKYNSDYCHCEPELLPRPTERDRFKEAKRKLKEDKLRRKLRKQRKKDQLEKECGSERMNCFHHDKEHWKTAPLWTNGPFCFCMNANNNTYSCVRTINSTHNFLYCEFTTGLVTFYNLRIDPFELQNRIDQLKLEEKSYLHDQLKHLMACKGKSCTVNHNAHHHHPSSRIRYHAQPPYIPTSQNRPKKRKLVGDYANGRGVVGTHGARINSKERVRNSTAMMGILREAGIRRRRRKT